MSGAPNPATESIVAPQHGTALELAAADGAITVDGFALVAAADAGSGVISGDTTPLTAMVVSNNYVQVTEGSAGCALRLNRSAVDATISGNVFVAAAVSAQCVELAGDNAFHGMRFVDNHILRDGLKGNIGLSVDGNRNLGPSTLRSPVIQGNLFQGHVIGFQGGSRSLAGAEISGNSFNTNIGGMAAGLRDSHLHDNEWSNNLEFGLRLTALGHAADEACGARNTLLDHNRFLDNGANASPTGYGDICFDQQAPGSQNTNVVRNNSFTSPVAVFNNDPGATIQASYNYWGAVGGPSGHASGNGGAILGLGAVTYEPFYADAAMTSLVFGTVPLSGELTLRSGQAITGPALSLEPGAIVRVDEGARVRVDELTMPAGSSMIVRRGSVVGGKLDLQPGAVLDVVDGDLALDPAGDGRYHTIAGSFTFFNCLGSLQINGNTTFSGETLGLVSDIHVLPGSTMAVLGSLVLDGCRLQSTGNFSLLVNIGANLTMTRCEVSGAAISLVGSGVTLKDNQFVRSSVTAFSTVNGARIYHNVFAGGLGLLNILPGAVVTTSVEGWANVADAGLVKNALALHFRAPSDPTRTLDASGNLYVQPGDLVAVGLDISNLNSMAQTVESLLGFSTDYLTVDSLAPSPIWSNGLYQAADESATLGMVNTAVGLSFSMPDSDGTTLDGQVADIYLVAKPLDGRTRVFFRSKTAADAPLLATRITVSSGGVPFFKEVPFTANAADLIVDGTPPEFATGGSAVQTQNALPVDVLQTGVFTRIGAVTVSFDVVDLLAGIDDSDVSANWVGSSGTLVGVRTGTSTVVIDEVTYTRVVFTFEVTSATPDGVYDVNGIAMDRSGNRATLPMGAVEVAKNQLVVTVQPQGLVSSPLTRDVVFTATAGTGVVLASWRVPIQFCGGTGSTVLQRVPDGTAYLSAKMDWNLRVRLPTTLDAQGKGSAWFTGAKMLPGGDFSGDNIINVADYNILRIVFPGISATADITGDGSVNVADYNILRANWFTAGDPP